MSKLKLQDLIDAISLQFDDSNQLLDRKRERFFLLVMKICDSLKTCIQIVICLIFLIGKKKQYV